MSAGLLVARLIFGSLIVAHGTQKGFGWFSSLGLEGIAPLFENLGFRPGRFFVAAAVLAECGAGSFLGLGLLVPAAAATILAVMIIAIVTVYWGHGLLATTNGVEVPLLYAGVAFCLAVTGPGRYSLDAALGLSAVWTPEFTAGVLTGGSSWDSPAWGCGDTLERPRGPNRRD